MLFNKKNQSKTMDDEMYKTFDFFTKPEYEVVIPYFFCL